MSTESFRARRRLDCDRIDTMNTEKTIVAIIIIIIAGLGIYFITKPSSSGTPALPSGSSATTTSVVPDGVSTTTAAQGSSTGVSIGKSVQGRDIVAYTFGTGSDEILFVGGIHGGYEWNTSLVAYELMDYLQSNPTAIPANEKVVVIPTLNPDGLAKVTGSAGRFTAADVNPSASVQVAGRFNANTVDLNRNFACDWKASGVWQSKTVSGGTAAFSEPESLAMKNFVAANPPAAAVVWYSAAGGVYASNCDGAAVSPATDALTKLFAGASGYPSYEKFDSYALSGDMVNWLASMNIPAISVLLTNHTDTEWTQNLAGIKAVLQSYAK